MGRGWEITGTHLVGGDNPGNYVSVHCPPSFPPFPLSFPPSNPFPFSLFSLFLVVCGHRGHQRIDAYAFGRIQ